MMQYLVSNSQLKTKTTFAWLRGNVAPFWDFVVAAKAEILSRHVPEFQLSSVKQA